MNTKNILKRIAGKKILEHKVAIISNIRFFRKYHDTSKVFRFFIYYFYFNIVGAFRSSNKIIQVNDYLMYTIPNDNGISRELSILKTHEPLVTKILKNELKSDMVCFDIGGNIGYYVLLENKQIGNNGLIVTFEPSPINFEYLSKNVILNNVSNVILEKSAIGDINSTIKFVVSPSSNSSHILQSNTNEDEKIIDVPIITLDSYVSEKKIKNVDLIRMDMEGYEYNAYNGMKETIKKFKPAILMEIHTNYLGKNKTKEMLNNFYNDNYEIKYYIPRKVDVSFIGNFNDVKSLSINDLTEKMEQNSIPDVFHLFLIHNEKL